MPDSAAYAEVRKPAWAQYAKIRPRAVVRCRTPADVIETIAFARGSRLELAIRSGGHCFAGGSSTHGLLIDLSRISAVRLSDDVATVGAGGLLGDIDDVLAAHGRAIVAGACPSVGIGGLTLGGGLGILGRAYGLTSDRLLAADVVLADGSLVTCDEQHHADLFWALRGAGAGGFGVVTSLTFRTVPPPRLTCFRLVWSTGHAGALVDAWQRFAPSARDELAASLLLNVAAEPGRPPSVSLFGAMSGAWAETENLLDEFVTHLPAKPDSLALVELPYRAAKQWLVEHAPGVEGEATEAGDQSGPPFLYAKSDFFRRPLPRPAIAALVDHLLEEEVRGQVRELDLTPWGGAYNRVDPQATAFVHRRELFLLKHAVTVGPDASHADREAAYRWLEGSWVLLRRYVTGGVFPNFADPTLTDPERAYHAANRERLARINKTYDAEDVF